MEFKFKRHFLINGIAMTSSLMNSKTTPVYHRIAAHADPAINQSQCKSIEIWAMKRFGKPSRIVDAGYDYDLEVAGNAMTEVVRKMQWDLGSTRFEFECYGMFPKSDSTRDGLVAFISIAQKENLKLLKPLIGLKCSQTLDLKAENGSEPKQLDDLNFIIDENQNKVLLPNNKPYPGKHDVTTDSISLKFKMKNYDTEYDLDRITGKFHTESKLPNGTTFYTSGSCEKRKLGDRKF